MDTPRASYILERYDTFRSYKAVSFPTLTYFQLRAVRLLLQQGWFSGYDIELLSPICNAQYILQLVLTNETDETKSCPSREFQVFCTENIVVVVVLLFLLFVFQSQLGGGGTVVLLF